MYITCFFFSLLNRLKQESKIVNPSTHITNGAQKLNQRIINEEKFNIKNLLTQSGLNQHHHQTNKPNHNSTGSKNSINRQTETPFNNNNNNNTNSTQDLQKKPTNQQQAAISNKFKLTNNKLQPVKSIKLDLNNNNPNFPRSSINNTHQPTSLVTPLIQQQNNIQSQLLLNQQAALAALTSSAAGGNINSGGNNSLMSLFSNPQLFMAMAAAASTINSNSFNSNINPNGLANGKKSLTFNKNN